MDREALRKQAAQRRNPSDKDSGPDVVWNCKYCNHPFATETGFMKHKCKGKAKIDKLRSSIGQSAYAYYTEWMKQNKRSVPPIESFAESSLYSTFIKFAEWVLKVRLPNPNSFIRAMVENGKVQPSLWCRDNVYAIYLQGYDNVVSPTIQFLNSYEVLNDLAFELHVEISGIFEKLGVPTILSLIEKRKLSPWFLIASTVFRNFLTTRSQEDKDYLEDALQIGAMLNRISHNEQLKVFLTEFSKATKELGL